MVKFIWALDENSRWQKLDFFFISWDLLWCHSLKTFKNSLDYLCRKITSLIFPFLSLQFVTFYSSFCVAQFLFSQINPRIFVRLIPGLTMNFILIFFFFFCDLLLNSVTVESYYDRNSLSAAAFIWFSYHNFLLFSVFMKL